MGLMEHIGVIGFVINHQDQGFKPGTMAAYMKVTIKKVKNMVKEHINGLIYQFTKDFGMKVKQKVKENICIKMESYIKETL